MYILFSYCLDTFFYWKLYSGMTQELQVDFKVFLKNLWNSCINSYIKKQGLNTLYLLKNFPLLKPYKIISNFLWALNKPSTSLSVTTKWVNKVLHRSYSWLRHFRQSKTGSSYSYESVSGSKDALKIKDIRSGRYPKNNSLDLHP